MNERYIARYSPLPMDAYSRVRHGMVCGPAASPLLNWDGEAWNLAWLSHPYETGAAPADSRFTTLVVQSVGMDRRTGAIDITGLAPPERTVRGLLSLPPDEFFAALETSGLATRLPLYSAYGEVWLDLVRQRAHADWRRAEQSTGMRIAQAEALLARFTKHART